MTPVCRPPLGTFHSLTRVGLISALRWVRFARSFPDSSTLLGPWKVLLTFQQTMMKSRLPCVLSRNANRGPVSSTLMMRRSQRLFGARQQFPPEFASGLAFFCVSSLKASSHRVVWGHDLRHAPRIPGSSHFTDRFSPSSTGERSPCRTTLRAAVAGGALRGVASMK
jgi:hypothetical protein